MGQCYSAKHQNAVLGPRASSGAMRCSMVKRYTVCPDFLRPLSDQLDAGQYVLASDYEAQLNVAVKCCMESADRLERIWKIEAALRKYGQHQYPCPAQQWQGHEVC